MQGLVDTSSIEWFPPHVTVPPKETTLTYDKDKEVKAV